MNKQKKDFMDQLNDLDDFSVEEIAEKYPALNKKTERRILKQCIKKDASYAGSDNDSIDKTVVSGTEHYDRKPWYSFAASAAAFAIAVGGITGVFMLNRNHGENNVLENEKASNASSFNSNLCDKSEESTAAQNNEPASFNENKPDLSSDNGNDNETQQTPHTEKEPLVDNSNDSSPIDTSSASTEQKSYLNGLYYVEISGVSGYLGFEFTPDGKLIKYAFDDYGNMVRDTIVSANYEIIGNQFSFGDLDSELNKKSGTIINSNDTGGFSVQFDDGLYYFSTERPAFGKADPTAAIPDTLNGLYYVEISGVSGYLGFEFMPNGKLTKYAFDDYGNIINDTIVTINYEIIGNYFSFGDLNSELNKKTGTIVNLYDTSSFSIQFDDGLYNFSTERPIFR